MAGSISLSLSQQFDDLGKPLSGGMLYFIQAGTTATPQNAFQDTGLTVAHPNPIVLDAAGRVPAFYLADGSIKIRLTDRNGVEQIVQDNLLVIGPSSGGGGGGSGVDPTAILATGDMKISYGTGSLSGFVRTNGRTIGAASSGATERANADCQALFSYLWNVDSNLVVSGGRGATANADWTAGKTLALPDWRGRTIAGLDDMGNSAAGVLTAAGNGFGAQGQVPTVLGAAGGLENQTLSLAQLPTGITSAGTADLLAGTVTANVDAQAFSSGTGGATGWKAWPTTATLTRNAAPTTSIAVTSTNTGGSAHPNVQPTRLTTIYMKL